LLLDGLPPSNLDISLSGCWYQAHAATYLGVTCEEALARGVLISVTGGQDLTLYVGIDLFPNAGGGFVNLANKKLVRTGKVYEMSHLYESSIPMFGQRGFTLRISTPKRRHSGPRA
jgi:hypothetical protein